MSNPVCKFAKANCLSLDRNSLLVKIPYIAHLPLYFSTSSMNRIKFVCALEWKIMKLPVFLQILYCGQSYGLADACSIKFYYKI